MPPRRSPAQRSPATAAIACERVSQSKVQSFKKGSGELLLPGAPQTAGIRFCCSVGPTAFYFGTLRASAPQLRSKSKKSEAHKSEFHIQMLITYARYCLKN